jgi:hypothetical protein
MRSRFRPSHGVVVAYLALFVALGGTATAVTYVVSSNSQIGPGTISGHKPPSGDHANIIADSINGTDIADQSGVDTCKTPLTAKFGPICAGSDGGSRTWLNALAYCTGFGLRLPTFAEAIVLAKGYDVPGVSGFQAFWTDTRFYGGDPGAGAKPIAWATNEAGATNMLIDTLKSEQTVCVTDPSA